MRYFWAAFRQTGLSENVPDVGALPGCVGRLSGRLVQLCGADRPAAAKFLQDLRFWDGILLGCRADNMV